MELFGIVLAFPAALVANVVYSLLVTKLSPRFGSLSPWLLWASGAVLVALVLEVALVATLGAVHTRRILGPPYDVLHVAVFFLGAPSLVNVLLIPGGSGWSRRWYAAAGLGFLLAIFLVFFQIGVSEALHGPD